MAIRAAMVGLLRIRLAKETSLATGEAKTNEAQALEMLLSVLRVASSILGGVSEGSSACDRAGVKLLARMGGTNDGPASEMFN